MAKHNFQLLGRDELMALPVGSSQREPYGVFITADGSEVLFDRGYNPMLRRDADRENIVKASGWIDDVVAQAWFYDDSNSPRGPRRLKRTQDTIHRCALVLDAFYAGKSIEPYVQGRWPNAKKN